jgi:predicted nucleic acid-binding protein
METRHKLTIIADSSALVSLIVITDSNHHRAASFIEQLSSVDSVVIPSEIFAEALNLLGKKFGHEQALQAAYSFLEAELFTVVPSTDVARMKALELYGTLATGDSYTDALVMAIADYHGTNAVFGFDDVFSKRGYRIPS